MARTRNRRFAFCATGLLLVSLGASAQAAADPAAPVGSDAPPVESPNGPVEPPAAPLADPVESAGAPYFDTSDPAVGNLDPALLSALTAAATQAAAEGINMTITSGWRTREEQLWLFDDAVRSYGSVDVARQYVQSPEVSHHVTGSAVDVAPAEADYWLIQHGRQYGLCQIYANEIWHFELAVDAYGNCPPLRPNAAG